MDVSEARERSKQAQKEDTSEIQLKTNEVLGAIYEEIQHAADDGKECVVITLNTLAPMDAQVFLNGDRYYSGVVYRVVRGLLEKGYKVSVNGDGSFKQVFDVREMGWHYQITQLLVDWRE